MWAESSTKTEGFENATAGTNYQQTVTISEDQSDCGIGWTIYYGTPSTNDKISGTKSAQMRYYNTSDERGYIQSTTAVEGLSNVAFKARVSSLDMKLTVSYSADGSAWTALATNVALEKTGSTGVTSFSYDIPSGGKYIKIEVAEGSTKPSSGNIKLGIDDVVFTYTAPTPDPEPDPEPTTRTLYCKVAQSWWKADGAAVGVYAFSEAGAENAQFPGVRMTAVEGAEDTWKADIDTALYKKVIFARMNPVDEGNQNWGAKTADLTIPADKDLYTITSTTPVWGDPGVTGEWSNYSPSVAPDPQPVLADGFYLIGKIGGVAGWAITDLKAEQKFAPNLENPVEFMINVTLAEGDELKVVNVLNNEITAWFPGDDNFIVTAAYAGEKTVYFRPDKQGGEGWHRGCIYIAPNPATGISNNAVEGKAVKMIMDGQFLIIRNGKTYNVQGQQLK